MNTRTDLAELRRLWHESEDPSVVGMDWANARHAMHDQFLALLDELEAARAALSQIYWKSIELGEDRGDSTINHIAADALKGDTSPLHARDRSQRLIGAAEKLEQLGCELNYMTSADMKAIAAKLRQEAEGK
jgi:hypothetical protein